MSAECRVQIAEGRRGAALAARAPRRTSIQLVAPLLPVLLLGAVSPATAQRVADHPRVQQSLELVRVWLEAQRDYQQIPGLSAAIVLDQDVIWSGGMGYAHPEQKTPAEPSTATVAVPSPSESAASASPPAPATAPVATPTPVGSTAIGAAPPEASLAAEGGDPVAGQLGTYTWRGGGTDSPWLQGAPMTVGSAEPLTVSFEPPVDIASWQARSVAAGSAGPVGATALGEGSGQPTFTAPGPGAWTVEVHTSFAGDVGSASYFWRLEVRG